MGNGSNQRGLLGIIVCQKLKPSYSLVLIKMFNYAKKLLTLYFL